MDTFGWIEFRRGNVETALPILESAAAKLTGDYVAQFHLGMAYAALDRKEEARQKLELALAMSEGKPFAQEEQARVKLNEINSTP
jgi:Flp pilus assembly protein TadD